MALADRASFRPHPNLQALQPPGQVDAPPQLRATGAVANLNAAIDSAPNPAQKRRLAEMLLSGNSDHTTEPSSNPACKIRRLATDEPSYLSLPELIDAGDGNAVRERLRQFPDLLNKPDPASGQTLLCHAVSTARADMVALLLDSGADINALPKQDASALMLAVCAGHAELVRLLCGRGAQVNLASVHDNGTALHMAARQGDAVVVGILLEAQANPDLQNDALETPLMLACEQGHPAVANILSCAGAAINAMNQHGDTALSLACRAGTTDLVTHLLQCGAAINPPQPSARSPLIVACENSHLAVASLLIAAGADITITNKTGDTALSQACHLGKVELVRLLLAQGAVINPPAETCDIPLLVACEKGHAAVAAMLLAAGADINVTNDGYTALSMACQSGVDDLVKLLLKNGATINALAEDTDIPLLVACKKGHTAVAATLVGAGADINVSNEGGETALSMACQSGVDDLVKLLLEHGAIVNPGDEEYDISLLVACENGHTAVAAMLLAAGADINVTGNGSDTALSLACQAGKLELVTLLLKNGAAINPLLERGHSPFMAACAKGHISVAATLIAAGAAIHATDSGGNTALSLACRAGAPELVTLLLEHGAAINPPGESSHSPFLTACRKGHTAIAKILIEKGADTNVADKNGDSALSLACRAGEIELVMLLLNQGFNINHRNRSSETPLMAACTYRNTVVVQKLIAAGAAVLSSDNEGNTALSLACRTGACDIVEMLLLFPQQRAAINQVDHQGQTPLMQACTQWHVDVAKKLIAARASVDGIDRNGNTALTLAFQTLGHRHSPQRHDLLDLLIAARADLDRLDQFGMTALHHAVQAREMRLIRQLVNADADLNVALSAGKQIGRTALDLALVSKDYPLAEYLLTKNAVSNFAAFDLPDPLAVDLTHHAALIAAPDTGEPYALSGTQLVDQPEQFCRTFCEMLRTSQPPTTIWSLWLKNLGISALLILEIGERIATLPRLYQAVAGPGNVIYEEQQTQLIAHLFSSLAEGDNRKPYANKGLSCQTQNRFDQMAWQQRQMLVCAGLAARKQILNNGATGLENEALAHYSINGQWNSQAFYNSLTKNSGLFAQTANRILPLFWQALQQATRQAFDGPSLGIRIAQNQALLNAQLQSQLARYFKKLLQEDAMSDKAPPGFREAFDSLPNEAESRHFMNAVFNQWHDILSAQGVTFPGVGLPPSLQ